MNFTLDDILVDLSFKQRRVLDREVRTLCSSNNWVIPKSIEDHKKFTPYHPHLKYKNGNWVYLNKKAVSSLERIVSTLRENAKIRSSTTYFDLKELVKEATNLFFNQHLQPENFEELSREFLTLLNNEVKEYSFVYLVSGIKFSEGLEKVNLGRYLLFKFDREGLSSIDVSPHFEPMLEQTFDGKVVIQGKEIGTRDAAESSFRQHSIQLLSMLTVYTVAVFEGATLRNEIRLVERGGDIKSWATSLFWTSVDGWLDVSRGSGGAALDSKFDKALVKAFESKLYLEDCVQLLESVSMSPLKSCIYNAIYWFGEAAKDRNQVMKFVKLWSCAEAFFSIEEGQLSELNAVCITVTLIYGGYSFLEVDDYEETKTALKRYYSMRSKALHRGHFDHITESDVQELGQKMAWLIIQMVVFSKKGGLHPQHVVDWCRKVEKGVCSISKIE